MEVHLKYGDRLITFSVPEENAGPVLRPRRPPVAPDAEAFLARELGPKLEQARPDCAGRDVLVLMADGTRDQPHRAGYAALLPLLRDARAVRVLLATGTHRADTPDDRRIMKEIAQASEAHRVPLASIGAHDCRTSAMYDAGTTAAGNAVRLNRLVQTADAILIVSDTVPHYFAGYSNAVKFLLPGVAAFECIERNHAFTLDPLATCCRHPLHPDPARRRNPLAEEQLEAARFVTVQKPVYALVMVSSGRGVSWATFGRLEPAVAEGIRFVDAHLVTRLDRRYRSAVISCGGYPNDETMYIAQRSLELTQEAVADGGEILWLAECRNGIASSRETADSFFTPLKGDISSYIQQIRRRYVMFGHKAVRFAQLMDRLSALHVTSSLPAGTFPAGRMTACADPGLVVAAWVRRGDRILFIDEANKQAVTAE